MNPVLFFTPTQNMLRASQWYGKRIGCTDFNHWGNPNFAIWCSISVSSYFGENTPSLLYIMDYSVICLLLYLTHRNFNINYFQDLVFLHISLNFQRIFGKHMSSCSLYDAWIESNTIYGFGCFTWESKLQYIGGIIR